MLAARHALARHLGRDRAEGGHRRSRIEGLCVVARRPEARRVLEAFLATEMGRACRMLTAQQAAAHVAALRMRRRRGVLWSPHELRVESRTAIPQLARWLEQSCGVTFLRATLVKDVSPPAIETTRGRVTAETAIVCPGTDFLTLFPERIAAYNVTTCKLHMLRVDPGGTAPALNAAVMSDLGLVRYLGYAELPEAAALKQRLEAEQATALAARRAPDRGALGRRKPRRRRQPSLWRRRRPVRAGVRRRHHHGRVRRRARSSAIVAFSSDGSATMRRRRTG